MLARLNQQLQTIGSELEQYLAKKINLIIAEEDSDFKLDDLLHQFSVLEAYKKATGIGCWAKMEELNSSLKS